MTRLVERQSFEPLNGAEQQTIMSCVRRSCLYLQSDQANYPEAGYTLVEGPANGELVPLQIDMNEMTDSFMTAAVLMARAAECTFLKSLHRSRSSNVLRDPDAEVNESSFSRITGVANQRVKECNRIKAMVDNLKR